MWHLFDLEKIFSFPSALYLKPIGITLYCSLSQRDSYGICTPNPLISWSHALFDIFSLLSVFKGIIYKQEFEEEYNYFLMKLTGKCHLEYQ